MSEESLIGIGEVLELQPNGGLLFLLGSQLLVRDEQLLCKLSQLVDDVGLGRIADIRFRELKQLSAPLAQPGLVGQATGLGSRFVAWKRRSPGQLTMARRRKRHDAIPAQGLAIDLGDVVDVARMAPHELAAVPPVWTAMLAAVCGAAGTRRPQAHPPTVGRGRVGLEAHRPLPRGYQPKPRRSGAKTRLGSCLLFQHAENVTVNFPVLDPHLEVLHPQPAVQVWVTEHS